MLIYLATPGLGCSTGDLLAAEKAMAPHSSALAWKIPWMEEPGGLPSVGSRGVGGILLSHKKDAIAP